MVVIIRSGPGFPLLCKGSHLAEGLASMSSPAEEIPQHEGSVVVFNMSMAIQDPRVQGEGGAGIILLY